MSLTMVLFGFAVGILVGLTGTGGGSVMTPLLIIVFGINPATAIGTDIAYSAVEKSVGGARQWRSGNVDMPLSTRMAIGSVPGAVAGVIVLKILERDLGSDFETVIFSALGAALLLTGAALLARVLIKPRPGDGETESVGLTRARTAVAIALGLFVGLVIGVTSAGSGALISAGLIFFFRLRPSRVVGTDLISTQISLRAPQGALRAALGVILIGAALGMLSKAGLGIPSVVLAIAPIAVIAIVAGAVLRELPGLRIQQISSG